MKKLNRKQLRHLISEAGKKKLTEPSAVEYGKSGKSLNEPSAIEYGADMNLNEEEDPEGDIRNALDTIGNAVEELAGIAEDLDDDNIRNQIGILEDTLFKVYDNILGMGG